MWGVVSRYYRFAHNPLFESTKLRCYAVTVAIVKMLNWDYSNNTDSRSWFLKPYKHTVDIFIKSTATHIVIDYVSVDLRLRIICTCNCRRGPVDILGVTNEYRTNVCDEDYARFRTNMARVVSIKSLDGRRRFKEAYGVYDEIPMKYTRHSIISFCDYDVSPTKVLTPGIHYFKTKMAGIARGRGIRYESCGARSCYRHTIGTSGVVGPQ